MHQACKSQSCSFDWDSRVEAWILHFCVCDESPRPASPGPGQYACSYDRSVQAWEWDGDEGGKIGILMSNVTQRSAAFKALQELSASAMQCVKTSVHCSMERLHPIGAQRKSGPPPSHLIAASDELLLVHVFGVAIVVKHQPHGRWGRDVLTRRHHLARCAAQAWDELATAYSWAR